MSGIMSLMGPGRVQDPWWDEEEGQAEPTLTALVDWLRENDSLRLERLRAWDELYRGTSPVTSVDYALRLDGASLEPARLAGLTRNAVDFLHSKVTAQVPGVRAVGSGAGWDQLRMRRMTHFIEGAMEASDMSHVVSQVVTLGLKHGTAGLKTAVEDGRLHAEPVPARELFFDPDDARHAKPRCMYQVRPMGRSEVLSRWGQDDDSIRDAILGCAAADDSHGQVSDDGMSWDVTSHDSIDVYEGWRRGPDGRHVICIKGATLLDEPWDSPEFQVKLFSPADGGVGQGIWGQGLVERLAGIQDMIDYLTIQIDESIRHARLKVFVDDELDIVDEHLQNPDVGVIVRTARGGTPQFVTPDTVGRQVFDHLWRLVDQLYAMVGMNQESSTGMSEAGLNASGVSRKWAAELQTARHVDVVKRVSRLTVDSVRGLIDAARMAYSGAEGEEMLTVRYSRGSSVRQVRWDQVDMDRDEYVVELLPVSPIPTTFSGQVQQIEEMVARGLPPPAYATALLSSPDVWKAARIAMADADYVDHVIERLLDAATDLPMVLQAQNLELTFDMCRVELLNAVREGAPPEVVERIDQYMEMVADEMPPPLPPGPPMAPPPGAPPVPMA